jgi:hypothetical protein
METHPAPSPAASAVVPVRLAAFGLLVVGATGVLTGLAKGDLVVLALVGIVPGVLAVVLHTVVGTSRPATASRETSTSWVLRFWLWLTTCAQPGCHNHPVHLGWCDEHGPSFAPGPEEYWEDR